MCQISILCTIKQEMSALGTTSIAGEATESDDDMTATPPTVMVCTNLQSQCLD